MSSSTPSCLRWPSETWPAPKSSSAVATPISRSSRQHLQRPLRVGHHRVLGDLQPQAGGREAAPFEHARDVRRQPEVEQVGGPEVDRHREVEPVAPALADLLQRPVEHERGQRPAEPGVVGQRQEVAPASAARAAGAPSAPAPRRRAPRRSRSPPSAGSAGPARRPRARRAARRAARAGAASDGRARAGRPRGRCACAWPRTSRRRRAGAARSRRRAWSGKSAMPIEASMCTRIPPTANERSSAERSRSDARRRRRLVAGVEHDRELVPAQPRERVARAAAPPPAAGRSGSAPGRRPRGRACR